MKNLRDFINEAMVSESNNNNDFNKVDKFITNESKIKKFIKDNESEVTEMELGDDDVKDIKYIMLEIHSNLIQLEDEDDREDYLENVESNIADAEIDADEDMIIPAVTLYKKLFKEIAHKELDD